MTRAMSETKKRGTRRRLLSGFLMGLSVLLTGLAVGVGISLSTCPPLGHEQQQYSFAPSARSISHSATIPTAQKKSLVPPLPHAVKYSHRPVDHLRVHNASLSPAVSMQFLSESTLSKTDSLYGYENYLRNFEGSVTYTWMALLHRLSPNDYVVLDAGMNTGFYTVLSAVMGFKVHAFDIQLDCFDVVSKLLEANGVLSKAQFYFLGLWNKLATLTVQEGCDPGRGIDNYQDKRQGAWNHRTHNVSTIPLDMFLESLDAKKQIVILKMDIEGSEIPALQGLSTHYLSRIQNIIMECAMQRMTRVGSTHHQARYEFDRLEAHGLTAFVLYQPKIPKQHWWNDTLLTTTWGVHALSLVHPISGAVFNNSTLSTNMALFKVADWDILLNKGACRRACNLLFTRMAMKHS